MPRFLARSWPFLILIALWLLFFWRYFAPEPYRVVYPDGDFTQQFFIFRGIAYRALAAGRMPLWADCFFAGYPFHADPQSQLFYPPIWISFAILKLLGYGHFPLFALTVEATLHYLAAAIFTFLFLKHELAALAPKPDSNSDSLTLAALLGSVTFTYGGFLTGYPPRQTGILETATWLPLALLCLGRLASSPAPPPVQGPAGALRVTHTPIPHNRLSVTRADLGLAALSALVLAIAFFAGHPQTFLFLGYVSIAYFIYRAVSRGRTWRWSLVCLAVMLALLGGLSSVQILPQAQFLMASDRPALPFEALSGGFPAGIVLQFFVTDLEWSPLHVGIVSLALAVLAVVVAASASVKAERAGIIFWLVTAAVSLLLSLGSNTPLYALAYYLLPGLRLFRHPERLAFIVSFATAALASFGAALLFRSLSRRARRAVRVGAALFVLSWGGAAWLAYRPNLPDGLGRIGLAVLGLAFAGVTIVSRLRGPLKVQRPARFLVLGLAAVNLFAAATRTGAVAPFDPYPYAAFLEPIRADPDPFFRVQLDATQPPALPGHFACGYGFREWGGIAPVRLASWVAFEDRAPESLRWKLMSVKYLITWKNGAITREDELPPAERVAEGPSPAGLVKVYRLFENPRRAWLVYRVQTAEAEESVYEMIGAPGFDPLASAVTAAPVDLGVETTDGGAGNGRVAVLEDRPGRLSLEVTSDRPALLVVSEAYYPGWAAAVNGQPAAVYQADGYVQAVPVPAGESTVILDYRPMPLILGAAISLLALFICAALLALRPRISNSLIL